MKKLYFRIVLDISVIYCQRLVVYCIFFLSFFFFPNAIAQTFVLSPTGSAVNEGEGCFNLTSTSGTDCRNHSGAIWSTTSVDFTNPFKITFEATLDAYYGGGADGICLVFGENCSTSTPPNDAASHLGYYGSIPDYTNNSFGIEFDTYDNGAVNNDIPTNHTSISKNASLSAANLIFAAVPINSTLGIKDNHAHIYTITWDPSTLLITVMWDCTTVATCMYDFRQIFHFSALKSITWGITGASGGACSNQKICTYNNQVKDVIGCKTGIILNPPVSPSIVSSYLWTLPTGGTASTETINATTSGTYTVAALYACGINEVTKIYNVTIADCKDNIPPCENDKILINKSSEISSGFFDLSIIFDHSIIEAGSSVATGGDPTVQVPVNKSTLFLGSGILLAPNFKAVIDKEHSFEVIPNSDCKCILENSIFFDPIIPKTSSGSPIIHLGCNLQLYDLTAGGTWSSDDNFRATVNASGLVTSIGSGNVDITYTVGGCSTTLRIIVIDKPCNENRESNFVVFTDSLYVYNTISVYPIPTKNNITIVYPCTSNGQLEIDIKDMSGRTMHAESVTCSEGNNAKHTIDINSFPSGVYFVNLTISNQHVVKKIVKQ